MIYVSHGRLAANLNGTIVRANQALPLDRWMRVSVTYDGEQLVVLANGKQIGQTKNFPTASGVMGPKWEWAATHPGDNRVPHDGIGPEGILAMRVIGAHASMENGEMDFSVPAGGHVMVLVASMDNRDMTGYFHAAISDLNQANLDSVAASWSRHLAWWRKFWSKS